MSRRFKPTGRVHIAGTLAPIYRGPVRLLVVEDDPRLAGTLRRGLAENGFAVDVTGDGTEAVWQAGEIDYDAVILDVLLPARDGHQVCRELREAGRWMPVLMLTARTDIEDRVHGLDCGADDCLSKPFNFAELSARLRALLRRGARPRPTVLTAGNLRLDPASRRVWRADTEIDLSAKEFMLLHLFLRHPGEVLSRTQIIDHVWDLAYDGTSKVVDQYVANLRRKIDRPFAVEQLETVRGVGYRLAAQPVTAVRTQSAQDADG
jgi:two-component system, OmpR family, response regulator